MVIVFCLAVKSFKDKSSASGNFLEEKRDRAVTFRQLKPSLSVLKNVYLGFCLVVLVLVPTVGVSPVRIPALIGYNHVCFVLCCFQNKNHHQPLESASLTGTLEAVTFLLTAYVPIL